MLGLIIEITIVALLGGDPNKTVEVTVNYKTVAS